MTPIEQLLPELYRKTPEDRELQRVLTWMLERAERDKEFTLEQLFPSTTSGWGLELWERAWGIPVDRTLSGQRRRDRILAKVKGTGTTTLEVIRAIAERFAPYPVEVVGPERTSAPMLPVGRSVRPTDARKSVSPLNSTFSSAM